MEETTIPRNIQGRLGVELNKHCRPAFPEYKFEEVNVGLWKVTFTGDKDTPFEGGFFKVSFNFEGGYPNKAPKIKVLTTIWNHKVGDKG